jgi:hypothetical protein
MEREPRTRNFQIEHRVFEGEMKNWPSGSQIPWTASCPHPARDRNRSRWQDGELVRLGDRTFHGEKRESCLVRGQSSRFSLEVTGATGARIGLTDLIPWLVGLSAAAAAPSAWAWPPGAVSRVVFWKSGFVGLGWQPGTWQWSSLSRVLLGCGYGREKHVQFHFEYRFFWIVCVSCFSVSGRKRVGYKQFWKWFNFFFVPFYCYRFVSRKYIFFIPLFGFGTQAAQTGKPKAQPPWQAFGLQQLKRTSWWRARCWLAATAARGRRTPSRPRGTEAVNQPIAHYAAISSRLHPLFYSFM